MVERPQPARRRLLEVRALRREEARDLRVPAAARERERAEPALVLHVDVERRLRVVVVGLAAGLGLREPRLDEALHLVELAEAREHAQVRVDVRGLRDRHVHRGLRASALVSRTVSHSSVSDSRRFNRFCQRILTFSCDA